MTVTTILSLQVTSRHLSQLRDDHPRHPFVEALANKERDLDKMVKQYGVVLEG